jgi:hypothetical protein
MPVLRNRVFEQRAGPLNNQWSSCVWQRYVLSRTTACVT